MLLYSYSERRTKTNMKTFEEIEQEAVLNLSVEIEDVSSLVDFESWNI